jgi:exopolysaccharide biosynthesis polyprenyl glycosylphosphotransferase
LSIRAQYAREEKTTATERVARGRLLSDGPRRGPLRLGDQLSSAIPGPPPARQQYARMYLLMRVTDGLALVLGVLATQTVHLGMALPTPAFLARLAVTPLLVAMVFAGFGLYRAHLFTSAEEFRRVIIAVSVVIAGLVTVSLWTPANRLWVGLSWLSALVLTTFSRRLWHVHVRRARARGRFQARTVVVGLNGESTRVGEVLSDRMSGFLPVGIVASEPEAEDGGELPVLGHLPDLPRVVIETRSDCVFVASSEVSVDEMRFISRTVRRVGAELRVTANLPEVLSRRLALQPVGGVMAFSINPVRLTRSQVLAKRAFDVVFSSVALVLTVPLFALIALAIKLTSPGPVFYRQQRVGQYGRPLTLLKFRTMVEGAETLLDALRPQNEASGPLFKMRRDPRVTRVGRWLRRWSLDELPQLLNVVGGGMSLVGPRPALPDEVSQYDDWHFDRLEVRPGLTGLWQVNGRSDLSFDEGARLDLFYVENWSLAHDIFILMKTLPAVLLSRGAY